MTRAGKTDTLRLWMTLRELSKNSGGYYIRDEATNFSRRRRKSLHKELKESGLVKDGHIVSPYRFRTSPLMVEVTPKVLNTKKDFKAWIIDAVSAKMKRSAFLRERRRVHDRYQERTIKRQHSKVKDFGKAEEAQVLNFEDFTYELSINYFAEALNVSASTIKRWRKSGSDELRQTEYKFTKHYTQNPHLWEEGKCYYSKRLKRYVRCQLQIKANTVIIYDKSFYHKKSEEKFLPYKDTSQALRA